MNIDESRKKNFNQFCRDVFNVKMKEAKLSGEEPPNFRLWKSENRKALLTIYKYGIKEEQKNG